MNAPFTLEDIISRNMNPEKLPTLQRVFDTVCEEAAIPESAESERSELAEKLLSAGETAVGHNQIRAVADDIRAQGRGPLPALSAWSVLIGSKYPLSPSLRHTPAIVCTQLSLL